VDKGPCERFICDVSDLHQFDNKSEYPPFFAKAWRYWNLLRGQAGVPLAKDFDPMAHMTVFRNMAYTQVVKGPPLDFCFRIIGTHIDDRMQDNYTNRRLSEFERSAPGSNIWQTYESVTNQKVPMLTTYAYIGPIDNIQGTTELSLPFADQGGEVCNVLAVISFDGDLPVTMSQTRWTP